MSGHCCARTPVLPLKRHQDEVSSHMRWQGLLQAACEKETSAGIWLGQVAHVCSLIVSVNCTEI